MISFIKQYSFATIVSNNGQIPLATHIPFTVDELPDKLVLSAHISKANEQAKYLSKGTSLVIFNGPHAYISPTHYQKKESVPTWDYLAVHAYGKASILTDQQQIFRQLENMISLYEQDYLQQWESLPEKFKSGMAQGIVAFEIEVEEFQGQMKLSQNRTGQERQNIVSHLQNYGTDIEKELAKYIRDLDEQT